MWLAAVGPGDLGVVSVRNIVLIGQDCSFDNLCGGQVVAVLWGEWIESPTTSVFERSTNGHDGQQLPTSRASPRPKVEWRRLLILVEFILPCSVHQGQSKPLRCCLPAPPTPDAPRQQQRPPPTSTSILRPTTYFCVCAHVATFCPPARGCSSYGL